MLEYRSSQNLKIDWITQTLCENILAKNKSDL